MKSRMNLSGSMAGALQAIPEKRWAYIEYQEAVSDAIAAYMEERDISKAELARSLGTSRAYVSKVLRGDANMTMETFTSLLHALGAKAVTHIIPKDGESSVVLRCIPAMKKRTPSYKWEGIQTLQGRTSYDYADAVAYA